MVKRKQRPNCHSVVHQEQQEFNLSLHKMKKPVDLNRSMDGKAISTEGDDLCEDMDEDV